MLFSIWVWSILGEEKPHFTKNAVSPSSVLLTYMLWIYWPIACISTTRSKPLTNSSYRSPLTERHLVEENEAKCVWAGEVIFCKGGIQFPKGKVHKACYCNSSHRFSTKRIAIVPMRHVILWDKDHTKCRYYRILTFQQCILSKNLTTVREIFLLTEVNQLGWREVEEGKY